MITTLLLKHIKNKLDKLQWSKKLEKVMKFTRSHETETHKRVLIKKGVLVNTPHYMFVDNDMYADINKVARV